MKNEPEYHASFWYGTTKPYRNIKKECPDTLLFFKMDDYYEIYFDDAKIVSKVLEIPHAEVMIYNLIKLPICIIKKDNGHSCIGKLVKEGWTVAICEKV